MSEVKVKPVYPQRRNNVEVMITFNLDDSQGLGDILQELGKLYPDNNHRVEMVKDPSSDSVKVKTYVSESDEEFLTRVENYEKELQDYEDWKSSHKEEVFHYEQNILGKEVASLRYELASLKTREKEIQDKLQELLYKKSGGKKDRFTLKNCPQETPLQ